MVGAAGKQQAGNGGGQGQTGQVDIMGFSSSGRYRAGCLGGSPTVRPDSSAY